MKKIFLTVTAALLIAGLAGCSKFLEQHSQNSPADLEELLYGGALDAANGTSQRYLHLLADESKELYYGATAINVSSTLMSSAGLYRWRNRRLFDRP